MGIIKNRIMSKILFRLTQLH